MERHILRRRPLRLDEHQPRRVEAFSLLLQADLNLHQWANAVDHLKLLGTAAPLDAEVAHIFAASMRGMEVPATGSAVLGALAIHEQILRCVSSCAAPAAQDAEVLAWDTLTLLKENGSDVGDAPAELEGIVAARTTPVEPANERDALLTRARFHSMGQPLCQQRCRSRAARCQILGTKPTPFTRARRSYVISQDDGRPESPALAAAVKSLSTTLADTLPVYYLRSGCNAPSVARVGKPVCIDAPTLVTLGDDSPLLLVVVDAHAQIAWNLPVSASTLATLGPALAYRVAAPRK